MIIYDIYANYRHLRKILEIDCDALIQAFVLNQIDAPNGNKMMSLSTVRTILRVVLISGTIILKRLLFILQVFYLFYTLNIRF